MSSSASNNKHTEWILETIDHLRRRKARPDVARICHVVKRRFGLSPAETAAKLEKLVDTEVVIKVDYKGNVSYRNAAKWRKSVMGCGILNSTYISTKVLEAILDICKRKSKSAPQDGETSSQSNESEPADKSRKVDDNKIIPGGPNNKLNSKADVSKKIDTTVGASFEELSDWLKDHFESFSSLRTPLTVILKREMDIGRIMRGPEGRYAIAPIQVAEIAEGNILSLKASKQVPPPPVPVPKKPYTWHGHPLQSQTTSLLPGPVHRSLPHQPSRRGRPPKHRPPGFGPGPSAAPTSKFNGKLGTPSQGLQPTNPLSKLKRILTTDESQLSPTGGTDTAKQIYPPGQILCDLCNLNSLANPKGIPEALLLCKDCKFRAHPSCMKYSQSLASRACRAPWQCMDCKTCFMCQDSDHPGQMLVCDGCDRGFHMSCHRPPVTSKPAGKWLCCDCLLEDLAQIRSEYRKTHNKYGANYHIVTDNPFTPAESPVSKNKTCSDGPLPSSAVDLSADKYPDCSGWSTQDVADFLTSAGFKNQAEIFKEQDIDGVSLLLLKRSDILGSLNLKIGPALKINRLIMGLQTAKQGTC